MHESRTSLDGNVEGSQGRVEEVGDDLKDETDAQVLDELNSDIECLKKKKDKWAMLLGMNKLQ